VPAVSRALLLFSLQDIPFNTTYLSDLGCRWQLLLSDHPSIYVYLWPHMSMLALSPLMAAPKKEYSALGRRWWHDRFLLGSRQNGLVIGIGGGSPFAM